MRYGVVNNADSNGVGLDHRFASTFVLLTTFWFLTRWLDGFRGSGSSNVTDSFGFDNVGDDFDTSTFTNCASEDLTGNITGYTSTELVDFANDDYRTKATSTLSNCWLKAALS